MIQIDRSELAQSRVAGGASKRIGNCPDSIDTTPGTSTQSGTASSVITVNGKTVIDQKVTF